MPKSSLEAKARHGVMAAGLGVGSTVIGSWIGTWMPWPTFSPFIANAFAGWIWNAWLWLVFAPIAWVVARIFPMRATWFVGVGGVSGLFFLLVLNMALSGNERFLEFPFYTLSCLFWFITGLIWAWGFARRGEQWFRKAQENAKAIAKSNERHYAQWVASSASTDTGDADAFPPAADIQNRSEETETKEAKQL